MLLEVKGHQVITASTVFVWVLYCLMGFSLTHNVPPEITIKLLLFFIIDQQMQLNISSNFNILKESGLSYVMSYVSYVHDINDSSGLIDTAIGRFRQSFLTNIKPQPTSQHSRSGLIPLKHTHTIYLP